MPVDVLVGGVSAFQSGSLLSFEVDTSLSITPTSCRVRLAGGLADLGFPVGERTLVEVFLDKNFIIFRGYVRSYTETEQVGFGYELELECVTRVADLVCTECIGALAEPFMISGAAGASSTILDFLTSYLGRYNEETPSVSNVAPFPISVPFGGGGEVGGYTAVTVAGIRLAGDEEVVQARVGERLFDFLKRVCEENEVTLTDTEIGALFPYIYDARGDIREHVLPSISSVRRRVSYDTRYHSYVGITSGEEDPEIQTELFGTIIFRTRNDELRYRRKVETFDNVDRGLPSRLWRRARRMDAVSSTIEVVVEDLMRVRKGEVVQFDDKKWVISSLRHSWDADGFDTVLVLSVPESFEHDSAEVLLSP